MEQNIQLKSEILKKSMGFNNILKDCNSGVLFNIIIDGKTMTDEVRYRIQGKELNELLNDLKNISIFCPIAGLNIKNIEMDNRRYLRDLSYIFNKIQRISVENANIPNLVKLINSIKDKNKIDLIDIKNSELNDIQIKKDDFKNMYRFSVEEAVFPTTIEDKIWNKIKRLPLIKGIFKYISNT